VEDDQVWATHPLTPQAPLADAATPTKSTLGIWSLVLTVVAFLPFAWIAGIVMACFAIAKSHDGRDHGKRYGIAALVVAALWFVGVASYAIPQSVEAIRSWEPEPGGENSTQVATLALVVGNCFDDARLSGLAPGERGEGFVGVSVKPCTEQHEFEVFHTLSMPYAEFPGTTLVESEARSGCLSEYQPFVGRKYERSALEISYYSPTEASWNQQHDRAIVCLIHESDFDTTGSLRGSRG
jgi:Septum formation